MHGDIVLLTDNDATAEQTVEALPQLIDRLREEGYELVTLSDLIATDDELEDAINTSKAGMSKGAALPVVSDDGESDEQTAHGVRAGRWASRSSIARPARAAARRRHRAHQPGELMWCCLPDGRARVPPPRCHGIVKATVSTEGAVRHV